MGMFVYLDESGDTGFRFKQGSTRYFVIGLLLVDDPIPIQAMIDDLRRELTYPPGKEVKFVNTRPEARKVFSQRLIRHQFVMRAIVIDKLLMSQADIGDQDSFYSFLVQLVLAHDNGLIRDAILVMDESVKSRKRQDYLAAYLRRMLNSETGEQRIRRVVHHGSHADNLIQAVDMIAGAIYYAYHREDDVYLKIIRPKLGEPGGDLWLWSPLRTQ